MSRSHRSHRYSLPLAAALSALSVLCIFSVQYRRKLRKYRSELEKQVQLRHDERKGRINAEKKLRKTIGFIESPFPDRRATPRQPILAPAARAFIRFHKKSIQYQHYEELVDFSHIWVLFVFHENTNDKTSVPAKIAPPRLGGSRVGCLSTRSPHRPNPIGLSVCELVAVTEQFIEIRGVDFVNGTPILDIKPYIPYDIIPSFYNLPMVTNSSGAPLPIRSLAVPSWIVESDIPLLPITFTASARKSLEEVVEQKQLKFYHSSEDAIEFISQVLRQDIRGVHQGRGKKSKQSEKMVENGSVVETGDDLFVCRLDNLELRFHHSSEMAGGIIVDSIAFQQNLRSPAPVL